MVVNLNESVDSEIEENWKRGCTSLIPEKSKERYQRCYSISKYWLNDKIPPQFHLNHCLFFIRRRIIKKN